MAFRLIYEGELLSANAGDRSAVGRNKHAIRKQLHTQLKRLWETDGHLKAQASRITAAGSPSHIELIAANYQKCGNEFVPLIRHESGRPSLYTSLDILFLRKEAPGAITGGGDLDNRLKTLFDGLQLPRDCGQMGEQFEQDERPMYVLLADDKLISDLRVGTDRLLRPPTNSTGHGQNHVILIIRVEISQYEERWY